MITVNETIFDGEPCKSYLGRNCLTILHCSAEDVAVNDGELCRLQRSSGPGFLHQSSCSFPAINNIVRPPLISPLDIIQRSSSGIITTNIDLVVDVVVVVDGGCSSVRRASSLGLGDVLLSLTFRQSLPQRICKFEEFRGRLSTPARNYSLLKKGKNNIKISMKS